jgi:uncharacterized protein YjiS (DUF1127 family)
MTMISTTRGRSAAASTRASSIFSRAVETLRSWRTRARERAELAALDDRVLRDIGLTRSDVYREYRKPFWRI